MPSDEFLFRIIRGMVPGHKIVPFVLRKRGLGTVLEDIGSVVGSVSLVAAAGPATLVSTNSLDNGITPGLGARLIFVEGLNASFNEVSEIVALNGLVGVVTTTSFLRIHKMTVISAGSTGFNGGAITATIGGANQCVISASTAGAVYGDNVSYQANYTIPNGKTGYILNAFVSAGKNNSGHIGLWVRPIATGVFQEGFQTDVYQSFNPVPFFYQLAIPAKTDLIVRGYSTTGIIDIFAYYSLLIVDDGA